MRSMFGSRVLVAALLGSTLVGCGAEDAPVAPEAETSVIDSTPVDTATPDTTTPDTTTPDTATPDTTSDAATPDTATPDTASDAATPDTASDTTTPDVADARDAADTTVADTAVTDAADTGLPSCGAAPYVKFQHYGIAASDKPLTPITVTGSVCPSSTVTYTPGKASGGPGVVGVHNVPDKIDIWFRATQTGALPAFSPEFRTDSAHPAYKFTGAFGAQWITFATDYPFAAAYDPAWNVATKGLIHIETSKGTPAAGACTSASGITYSVMGHAEAVVKYEGGGTTTASSGRADITIVTSGTATVPEMVTLIGTKTGCTVTSIGGGGFLVPQTGKIPVAVGHTTGTVVTEIRN